MLVVDDDGSVRATLATALVEDGYEVRAATSAWEGLAAVVGWRPDLIVLDLVLVAVDGHAFARAVRRDPVLRRVPILLLSATDAGELAAEAARIGADEHLPKPLTVEEFLAAVRRLSRAAVHGRGS